MLLSDDSEVKSVYDVLELSVKHRNKEKYLNHVKERSISIDFLLQKSGERNISVKSFQNGCNEKKTCCNCNLQYGWKKNFHV